MKMKKEEGLVKRKIFIIELISFLIKHLMSEVEYMYSCKSAPTLPQASTVFKIYLNLLRKTKIAIKTTL